MNAKKITLPALFVFGLALTGCNLVRPDVHITTPGEDLSIVRAFVEIARQYVDPATYPLYLKDNSEFGRALEAELRGKGYAVFSDNKKNGVKVKFQMGAPKDEITNFAVILSFDDVVKISRLYERTPTGQLVPVSPFSVLK